MNLNTNAHCARRANVVFVQLPVELIVRINDARMHRAPPVIKRAKNRERQDGGHYLRRIERSLQTLCDHARG